MATSESARAAPRATRHALRTAGCSTIKYSNPIIRFRTPRAGRARAGRAGPRRGGAEPGATGAPREG